MPAAPPPPGPLSCPGSSSASGPHHGRTPTSPQHRLCMAPFFLAHLPGFLHAQGKHLQAATRNATAGRLPGNGTTPSPLVATKKLGGALWAPYDRGACTSTARDTQRHLTPPEPVPLHNISSTSSCVYSNHNVHMYTLNKVITPLPLVLMTSYCVGTSTARR